MSLLKFNTIKKQHKFYKSAFSILFVTTLILLFFSYAIGQKTVIQKSLYCFDENSKQYMTVTVSGIYRHYLLRNDSFDGTIHIADKKVYTINQHLRQNSYGDIIITDEYGQPYCVAGFLQYKKFSYICLSDSEYYLYSQWNKEWNKALP